MRSVTDSVFNFVDVATNICESKWMFGYRVILSIYMYIYMLLTALLQVLSFKANCPDCSAPCDTNMKVVGILCVPV